jgi:hypothetical protein
MSNIEWRHKMIQEARVPLTKLTILLARATALLGIFDISSAQGKGMHGDSGQDARGLWGGEGVHGRVRVVNALADRVDNF